MLRFVNTKSKSGGLVLAYDYGWHWSRDGGNYDFHRDFFWIHWEAKDYDPGAVRLHVESPRYADDPALNELKRDILNAVLESGVQKEVERAGLHFAPGSRNTPELIRSNKCTEAFRVIIPENASFHSHQARIRTAHAGVGAGIGWIIGTFAGRLRSQFGTWSENPTPASIDAAVA